jgi:hypothetical protein
MISVAPVWAWANRRASSLASLAELTKKHTSSGSGSVPANRSAYSPSES